VLLGAQRIGNFVRVVICNFNNYALRESCGFIATVGPQPLRRLITPIGSGDKFIKPKYWLRVFGQAFFEKGCDQAFFKRLAG